MPKVTLVTTPFNRSLQFYRGMYSLIQQKTLPDEIIVIDDGSTDDTMARYDKVSRMTSERQPSVSWKYFLTSHSEHRISCVPKNIGIKESSGEVVIFCESEMLHTGDSIKAIVDALQEKTFVVLTQIWTVQKEVYKTLSEDEFQHPEKILNHQYAQLTDSANLDNTKAPNSDWAITGTKNCMAGCCFGVWKKDLLDIGGFDEDFEGFAWDDFDLYARLSLKGIKMIQLDEPAIIHQWHEKNYPYNIYTMGEENGKKSESRIKSGEYRANIGKEWGVYS